MADDTQGRSGLNPAFIGGGVLVLALLDFVFQNTGDVRLHFLMFDTVKPLWLMLLITSALAIGAAEVLGWAWRRRRD